MDDFWDDDDMVDVDLSAYEVGGEIPLSGVLRRREGAPLGIRYPTKGRRDLSTSDSGRDIRALELALAPFSELISQIPPEWPDNKVVISLKGSRLTVGHLRDLQRARGRLISISYSQRSLEARVASTTDPGFHCRRDD